MRALTAILIFAATLAGTMAAQVRPNIVWIVHEDTGPEYGCYGDAYAHTPTIDKLASQGARFKRCFTHAPVCAPSRSGLISGMYPTSIGSHHMRSQLLSPPPAFTTYLKNGGYHVSWPGKTDFNFNVQPGWFDSTTNWMKPEQLAKQPFFAYINFTTSHESQIRAPKEQLERNLARLKPHERHDPAKARLPAYYPDTPQTRRDWANYYDLITAVDYQVSDVLEFLDKQGLSENTVVFFFGDHGRGLPRGKRWVYDSGTRTGLIIRWPGKIKPGTVVEDIVSFVDFAPTVLSIAGVEIPKALQGQAFLGSKKGPKRKYAFAARDRMDETYDRIRSVRDQRFRYIRNYHPELPYAQNIAYMDMMPTMQAWRDGNAAGTLKWPQTIFFSNTKPVEELYDLESDPDEVNNLSVHPKYEKKMKEMRKALEQWTKTFGDKGATPEKDLIKQGLVADKLAEYEVRRQPGFQSK